jgi:GNAT superfamily N-acetyltransferase
MLRYKRLKQKNFESCKIIFYEIFNQSKLDFQSEWESMLKYGRIYGLYDNQDLIGFCSWVHFTDDSYVTLCNLVVDKSLHRKGYGTRIVKYILNKIKNKNVDVIAQTNERLFFESVGFEVIIDFEDDDTQPYQYYMKYILEK